MSTADGSVGSMVKVVDHGPPTSRWNLVVVGDGYRAGELDTYHADVDRIIDRIYTTPPFDELWCGINVYRIDVVSTDSGADDPTACAGGTGATPRTYFDATFCSPWGAGRLDRLLTVDAGTALSVAQTRLPQTHQVLVIVNSSKYGGSGGTVAVCSTEASAAEIAIHEIGHSAFGLADEYENGGSAAGGAEPVQPNVTLNTNRATLKWGDLVAAATPLPSSCYGDCPTCTPPATPPPAGAVGAYEGAVYAHCGAFRPLPRCYMRDYGPFCPVCTRVIRQTLRPFLPTETITLATPGIRFLNVPEGVGGVGVTTWRAIVFETRSCRRLTFRITAGPTGGFGTPAGASVTVLPAETGPLGYARIWLSYTSTTPPSSASGSVTVRCDETLQTWTIPINANTVPRPKSAIVLVLDRSGSMAEDAGDGTTKVQKLREAAHLFVEAMQPGDGLGMVRFDDTAQRLMAVTDVGPVGTGAGRAAARGHIDGPGLDPAGATSIGDGVLKGKQALDDAQAAASPPYDVLAMLVLTDGVENTPPMLSAVGSGITANTFAIGLGQPYNISVAALNTLTLGHGGYLLVTGTLTADQSRRLNKYFLQVLAGITSASVVLDPEGELWPGAEHRVPFLVSEADVGIDVFLLCPAPGVVNFGLETPDGTRIDGTSLGAASFVTTRGGAYFRVPLPAIPAHAGASHAGTWNAVLSIEDRPRGNDAPWSHGDGVLSDNTRGVRLTLPYDVVVHAYSSLVLAASASQTGYEPGARVHLGATLKEYDAPVEQRASVWAEVTRPDGITSSVTLSEAAPGAFAASFSATSTGLHRVRVRATGETYYGRPFTREQTLTVAVLQGGDRQPPGDGVDGRPGGERVADAAEACCERTTRLLWIGLFLLFIIALLLLISLFR
jgi:hypothetical protein